MAYVEVNVKNFLRSKHFTSVSKIDFRITSINRHIQPKIGVFEYIESGMNESVKKGQKCELLELCNNKNNVQVLLENIKFEGFSLILF